MTSFAGGQKGVTLIIDRGTAGDRGQKGVTLIIDRIRKWSQINGGQKGVTLIIDRIRKWSHINVTRLCPPRLALPTARKACRRVREAASGKTTLRIAVNRR